MRWMVVIGRVSRCWERQSSLRSAEDALDLAFESGEGHVHVQRHGDGRVPGFRKLVNSHINKCCNSESWS